MAGQLKPLPSLGAPGGLNASTANKLEPLGPLQPLGKAPLAPLATVGAKPVSVSTEWLESSTKSAKPDPAVAEEDLLEFENLGEGEDSDEVLTVTPAKGSERVQSPPAPAKTQATGGPGGREALHTTAPATAAKAAPGAEGKHSVVNTDDETGDEDAHDQENVENFRARSESEGASERVEGESEARTKSLIAAVTTFQNWRLKSVKRRFKSQLQGVLQDITKEEGAVASMQRRLEKKEEYARMKEEEISHLNRIVEKNTDELEAQIRRNRELEADLALAKAGDAAHLASSQRSSSGGPRPEANLGAFVGPSAKLELHRMSETHRQQRESGAAERQLLVEQLARREADLLALQDRAGSLEAEGGRAQAAASLAERQLARLQQELSRSQEQASERVASAKSEAETAAAALKREREQSEAALVKAQTDAKAAAEDSTRALRERLEKVEAQLDTTRQLAHQKELEAVTATERLHVAQRDVAALQGSVDELKAVHAEDEVRLQEASARCQELQAANSELDKGIQLTKQKVVMMQSKVEAFKTAATISDSVVNAVAKIDKVAAQQGFGHGAQDGFNPQEAEKLKGTVAMEALARELEAKVKEAEGLRGLLDSNEQRLLHQASLDSELKSDLKEVLSMVTGHGRDRMDLSAFNSILSKHLPEAAALSTANTPISATSPFLRRSVDSVSTATPERAATHSQHRLQACPLRASWPEDPKTSPAKPPRGSNNNADEAERLASGLRSPGRNNSFNSKVEEAKVREAPGAGSGGVGRSPNDERVYELLSEVASKEGGVHGKGNRGIIPGKNVSSVQILPAAQGPDAEESSLAPRNMFPDEDDDAGSSREPPSPILGQGKNKYNALQTAELQRANAEAARDEAIAALSASSERFVRVQVTATEVYARRSRRSTLLRLFCAWKVGAAASEVERAEEKWGSMGGRVTCLEQGHRARTAVLHLWLQRRQRVLELTHGAMVIARWQWSAERQRTARTHWLHLAAALMKGVRNASLPWQAATLKKRSTVHARMRLGRPPELDRRRALKVVLRVWHASAATAAAHARAQKKEAAVEHTSAGLPLWIQRVANTRLLDRCMHHWRLVAVLSHRAPLNHRLSAANASVHIPPRMQAPPPEEGHPGEIPAGPPGPGGYAHASPQEHHFSPGGSASDALSPSGPSMGLTPLQAYVTSHYDPDHPQYPASMLDPEGGPQLHRVYVGPAAAPAPVRPGQVKAGGYLAHGAQPTSSGSSDNYTSASEVSDDISSGPAGQRLPRAHTSGAGGHIWIPEADPSHPAHRPLSARAAAVRANAARDATLLHRPRPGGAGPGLPGAAKQGRTGGKARPSKATQPGWITRAVQEAAVAAAGAVVAAVGSSRGGAGPSTRPQLTVGQIRETSRMMAAAAAAGASSDAARAGEGAEAGSGGEPSEGAEAGGEGRSRGAGGPAQPHSAAHGPEPGGAGSLQVATHVSADLQEALERNMRRVSTAGPDPAPAPDRAPPPPEARVTANAPPASHAPRAGSSASASSKASSSAVPSEDSEYDTQGVALLHIKNPAASAAPAPLLTDPPAPPPAPARPQVAVAGGAGVALPLGGGIDPEMEAEIHRAMLAQVRQQVRAEVDAAGGVGAILPRSSAAVPGSTAFNRLSRSDKGNRDVCIGSPARSRSAGPARSSSPAAKPALKKKLAKKGSGAGRLESPPKTVRFKPTGGGGMVMVPEKQAASRAAGHNVAVGAKGKGRAMEAP